MDKGIIFSDKNEYGRAFAKIALLLSILAGVYFFDLLLLYICTRGHFFAEFANGRMSQPQNHILNIAYILILYISITATIILFRNKNFKDRKITDSYFSGEIKKPLFLGILIGAVLFFIFFLAISPFSQSEKIEFTQLEIIKHAILHIIPCFLLVISEEVIFRGVIFEIFAKFLKKNQAIIFTSAMFGLAHLFCHGTPLYKFVYFLNLFTMSIILCTAVVHFKNIWCSTGIHFIFVYLILMRNYLKISLLKESYKNIFLGFDNSPVTGLIALGIMVIVLIIYKFNFKEDCKK